MNDGLQMRVVEVEHVRADAVHQRRVHDVQPLAAPEHGRLRRSGERRQRRDRAIHRLVPEPPTAQPTQLSSVRAASVRTRAARPPSARSRGSAPACVSPGVEVRGPAPRRSGAASILLRRQRHVGCHSGGGERSHEIPAIETGHGSSSQVANTRPPPDRDYTRCGNWSLKWLPPRLRGHLGENPLRSLSCACL